MAALIHDIEYLTYSGDATRFDWTAIKNSDFSVAGLATKLGLLLRSYYGWKFNTHNSETYHIGQALRHYIQTNPKWQEALSKYNVIWTDQPEDNFIQDQYNSVILNVSWDLLE